MISFIIDGKDYEKLTKFHKKHENCLEKHPNTTGAQYSYSFISDGLGTLKSCKCVCGKAITMSSDYIALRAFLFGYGAGVRAQGEEECYWSHDLGYEVDEELRKMTGGKEFSDEEMFNKFFDAFDLVLNRDYPQYIEDMNWAERVIKKNAE